MTIFVRSGGTASRSLVVRASSTVAFCVRLGVPPASALRKHDHRERVEKDRRHRWPQRWDDPRSLLRCLSTPYSRSGVLYEALRECHGIDHPDVRTWRATSLEMNPTLPVSVIARDRERDPAAAETSCATPTPLFSG